MTAKSSIEGVLRSADDAKLLQEDIDRAVERSEKWLMLLHMDKCKVMHVSKRARDHNQEYSMAKPDGSRHTLEVTTCQSDFGELVSCDLKVKQQIEVAVSRANCMLGSLKKTFRSRGKELWKVLYTTYVRPHLEIEI
jgi:hypothetical protein